MSDFKYIVTIEDDGMPLKQIVRTRFNFSSRLLTKLKKAEAIKVDGQFRPGWMPVIAGETVTVEMPDEQSHFPPENIPLEVVYEDDDVLVINKQPGLVVHPTKGKPIHTIANALMFKIYQDATLPDGSIDNSKTYMIRFVNRLDMNTSGLLIIAKNSHAQDNLVKQMKADHMNKRYLAICDGWFEEASGTVNQPLGRPDEDEVERWIVPESRGGLPSVTHYSVRQAYVDPSTGKKYSLVELRLETGRTHQIRIHLASIGHPVTGDHLYCNGDPFEYRRIHGDPRPPKDGTPGPRMEPNPEIVSDIIDRQALHAYALTFKHPVNGSELHLEVPLPKDMQAALNKLNKA